MNENHNLLWDFQALCLFNCHTRDHLWYPTRLLWGKCCFKQNRRCILLPFLRPCVYKSKQASLWTDTFHPYSCHDPRKWRPVGTGSSISTLVSGEWGFDSEGYAVVMVITPFTKNNADNHFLMHTFDDLKEIR